MNERQRAIMQYLILSLAAIALFAAYIVSLDLKVVHIWAIAATGFVVWLLVVVVIIVRG